MAHCHLQSGSCTLMLQENAGGVSRDEMAATLMEVVDGRLPKDRIALRELYNEIIGWPWLDAEEDQTEGVGEGEAVANYEGITPTGSLSHAVLKYDVCFSLVFHVHMQQACKMAPTANVDHACIASHEHCRS